MREMIKSKETLYECDKLNNNKENNRLNNESEQQVDFSLTMNDDDSFVKPIGIEKKNNAKKNSSNGGEMKKNFGFEYEQVKKNLFDEVDKLQNYQYESF